jgi:hypothetical protein
MECGGRGEARAGDTAFLQGLTWTNMRMRSVRRVEGCGHEFTRPLPWHGVARKAKTAPWLRDSVVYPLPLYGTLVLLDLGREHQAHAVDPHLVVVGKTVARRGM